MLQFSCKFGESKWNPGWDIVFTSLSGTNYVLKEHEDFDQYGPYAVPSELIPCYSYPASFVNQNEIPIDLSCYTD